MKNLYIVIFFSVMPSFLVAQNGEVNSSVLRKDTQNKEKVITGKSPERNKIQYKNGDVYEGEFVSLLLFYLIYLNFCIYYLS